MSNYTLEQLTGRPPRTWTVILSTVGLLAIAIGTMLPILNVYFHPGYLGIWWKVFYAVGALCFLVSKLFSPYTGQHMRLKRLYRIETWSAIFFCVAAFFLFYNGDMTRDSWAFTLAGGALLVFTTLQIPRIIRKELDSSDADDATTNQSSKKTKK